MSGNTPRKSQVANEFRLFEGRFFIGNDYQCDVDSPEFEKMIDQKAIKAIRIQSLRYVHTVSYWNGSAYIEDEINVEMTIRGEWRNGKKCWYAYRKRGGVLMKRYIGYSLDVKSAKLAKVANSFPK